MVGQYRYRKLAAVTKRETAMPEPRRFGYHLRYPLGLIGLTLMAFAAPLAQAVPSAVMTPTNPPQTEHALHPGARIRATIGSGKRYGAVGKVLKLRGDTIEFEPDGSGPNYALLRSQLTEVQISKSTSSYGAAGLLFGGLAGAVLGYVGGAAGGDDTPNESNTNEVFTLAMTRGDKASAGAWLGGAAGALLGLCIGSSIHNDLWETIPVENVAIITPRDRVTGWGITLSFHRN
jgi:hypothetical protein